MPHRPDPTDLNPLKFILFGETPDAKPFSTGFWTRDYSVGSPPDLTAATAFVTKIKAVVYSSVDFLGWGWRTKAGSIYTLTAFAAPVVGTAPSGSALASNSATLSYGGVAIDNTGVSRNIRCISHVPRGAIYAGETGVKFQDRTVATVAAFLDWFATQHPTDNFGRPLNIYPVMDMQQNAYYQQRSGF